MLDSVLLRHDFACIEVDWLLITQTVGSYEDLPRKYTLDVESFDLQHVILRSRPKKSIIVIQSPAD
ncbi:hypothetical protein GcC1_060025 [Golovinomyces cichoracearum]|uniref:Uncharacterized protein n=1 Tax=Golovinomyces cichoracearum TaxID=62708 RepID=A0A420ITL5_9PEZI|nr:hypothetical protein GcC1_060025 [Golovinomyces cichoracearum]